MTEKSAMSFRELLRAAVAESSVEDLSREDPKRLPASMNPKLSSVRRSRIADAASREIARIRAVRVQSSTKQDHPPAQGHKPHFPEGLFGPMDGSAPRDHADVFAVVRAAWTSMFRTYPEDHVVANPIFNREFLARCRALGATVGDLELNRLLLNGRKASRFTGVERVKLPHMARAVADRLTHVSEIAARYVQLTAIEKGGEAPAIDRMLCDPNLRNRFDLSARRLLVEDFGWPDDELYYNLRLALLKFRKAGTESAARRGSGHELPSAHVSCDLADLSLSRIPAGPGLYRVLADRHELFIGNTVDLRERIKSHIDSCGRTFVPPEWKAFTTDHLTLHVHPAREDWSIGMVAHVAHCYKLQRHPLLNLYAIVA